MLNSEIKYKISTNYKELYKLLKYDKLTIIGFIGISLNGVVNENYSKLIQMSYNQKNESFDIGFIFFESDFDEMGFEEICLKYNLRYIPI